MEIWSINTFVLGFLITLPFSALTDVYTLKKDGVITCVLPEASEEAIFINPPVEGLTKTPSDVIDWNWKSGDWFREYQDVSAYGLIFDKRWQDLKSFKTSDKTGSFSLDNNRIPLSVYLNESITFRVISRDHRRSHRFTVNKFLTTKPNGRWVHFILRREGNDIQIFSEEGVIIHSEKIDFNGPYWIRIETFTWFKLHEPDYWWSTTSTNSQEENYINVSLSDNLCISVYTSVDKGSILKITLEANDNPRSEFVLGFNKKDKLKTWKKQDICADSPGPARLFLKRVTNVQKAKDGYWAFSEMALSSRDTEIYHAKVPTTNSADYRCETLLQTNDHTYDIHSMVDTPGNLGNVSCEIALGPSYPYCEKHEICLHGHKCFCSWGYQGPSCGRKCDEGYHGLFCTERCTNCTRCHPSTGTCFENNDTVVMENETSKLSPDISSITSEATTLSSESGGNQENEKVQHSNFADEMNPSTITTTSTDSTTPRPSTTETSIIVAAICLVFFICAVGLFILWILKYRNRPPSSGNHIGYSTARILVHESEI